VSFSSKLADWQPACPRSLELAQETGVAREAGRLLGMGCGERWLADEDALLSVNHALGDQRQAVAMEAWFAFQTFRPCTVLWHEEQSVIKFSSASAPEWLRNSWWCTSRLDMAPHDWHLHSSRRNTSCRSASVAGANRSLLPLTLLPRRCS
jgi:hypothetical protein